MCIRDRLSTAGQPTEEQLRDLAADGFTAIINLAPVNPPYTCLLYTSDAADERSSVDLGGRRIIKKKN